MRSAPEALQPAASSVAVASAAYSDGRAPVAAYIATGAAWFFLFHGGIFYPLLDAGDMQNSWGPKRVGQK